MVVAKKFVYAKKFQGPVSDDNLQLQEEEMADLKDGDVLFAAEYLCVDPYTKVMTEFMNLETGTTFMGEQVARVVESKHSNYEVGKHFLIHSGIRTHSIVSPGKDSTVVKPIKDYGLPLSLSLGVLGVSGATAYCGVKEILKPKEGEIILVNAAAGGVGNVVGQIGKILGCKVIGCAGSEEKVAWLKTIGFDVAFNYKTDDLSKVLNEAAPSGVDCFFDNVGGEFRNKVLSDHMAVSGRVAICGGTSGYNESKHVNIDVPFYSFLTKVLTMRSFHVDEFILKHQEAFDEMAKWIKEKKLQPKEHVTEGFDYFKKAFCELFTGGNTGKAIVKV